MSAQELITDHLDLWTSAVTHKSGTGRGKHGKIELTGIKKLRELILELAVRGKLVEQDPNDEPASMLLERIAEEKARFVKEGKIKKPNQLLEVPDEEKPFELPEMWSWIRLGNISQINPRNDADGDLQASFIPMPLISTSHNGKHGQELRPWGEIKKGYTHFADGDIAIAKITPCFENSKAAVFSNLKNGIGAGTTELHVTRPFGNTLNPRYVLLCLKSPRFLSNGEQKMTGSAGQKRVPKDFFAGEPLPLPPLGEQHRIVEKVDELMALCDRLEQQIGDQLEAHEVLVGTLLDALTHSSDATELAENWARLAEHFDTLFTTEASIDTLKQTILQLAVMGRLVPQDPNDEPAGVLLEKIAEEKARLVKEGKIKKQKQLSLSGQEPPYPLPASWKWEKVGNFTLIGTGATPSRDRRDYYSHPAFSWVTSGETTKDKIFETKEKVSKLAVQETNITIYPIGTLIVAMYGQGKTRGQITELMIEAGTNQACAAIQPVNKQAFHRKYIKLCFIKLYEELREGAAGGAQPNLNTGKISNTLIPLPPLQEQLRIVEKVDELMALCDKLKSRLGKASKTRAQLAETVVEQAVS